VSEGVINKLETIDVNQKGHQVRQAPTATEITLEMVTVVQPRQLVSLGQRLGRLQFESQGGGVLIPSVHRPEQVVCRAGKPVLHPGNRHGRACVDLVASARHNLPRKPC
jgi:hypothetical protein